MFSRTSFVEFQISLENRLLIGFIQSVCEMENYPCQPSSMPVNDKPIKKGLHSHTKHIKEVLTSKR